MRIPFTPQACPGRWFVTSMIKILVARILLTYDIKLVGAKPKTAWIGTVIVPPRKARVMVRRRGNEY
jgi:cytochrome P450